MPATAKIDLTKEHREEYVAPREPKIVNTRPAHYLALAGRGAPADEEFQKAIGALYSVAFTVKMAKKFAGIDYKVCHLEALWWSSHPGGFLEQPTDSWNWKLLIRVPDFVTKEDVKRAVEALKKRGREGPLERVRIETLREGQCVQALHVGPYDRGRKTIEQMMECAHERGLAWHGRHHEIYLSDPRRVPPKRLRTLLRHPVRKSNTARGLEKRSTAAKRRV
jgi:hypothetical protein